MKRLLFLLLALMMASSVWAAPSTVQVMEGGKIKLEYLPTTDFSYETDPANATDGQVWWNETTKQLKVADPLGVYSFNATELTEWDTTPTAFSFTDIVNATVSTVYESNAITVAGINHIAPISATGSTGAGYTINDGNLTSENGTVSDGDIVTAVVPSSADTATETTATVTIGGVSDVYSVTTGGGAYLVDEDFEGTGIPSGWKIYHTYQTFSFDYDSVTPDVIDGTQSLKLYTTAGGYGGVQSPSFAGSSGGNTVYFKFRPSSLPLGTSALASFASGSTKLAEFMVFSTGRIGVRVGTSSVTLGDYITAGNTYYLKLEYIQGTGSNAVGRVSLWDGSAWDLQSETTSGTSTLTASSVILGHPSSTAGSTIFDSIQVEQ